MCECNPIGYYKLYSDTFFKDTLPRQPQGEHIGRIVLEPDHNFEMALEDLLFFSHIWLIFWFHEVSSWRPKVNPPKSEKKRGVFATRSPHRPNPIGLSVVELLSVDGRTLTIRSADLLDGTPILDIKPYLALYDSVPHASMGWLQDRDSFHKAVYQFLWNEDSSLRAAWVEKRGLHIRSDIERSLQSLGLTPNSSNRIQLLKIEGERVFAVKAYRTWRIYFTYAKSMSYDIGSSFKVQILALYSGYSDEELALGESDKWLDKDLHREFNIAFRKVDIKALEKEVLES